MVDEVLIYGKDNCPYTAAAIEDYQARKVPYRYIDVKKDRAELEHMLGLTEGRRQVPVIVEAGRVTIGFGGT
ncbi:MAG TPA: UXX-star (seleno)protein family 1 [Vicinamibacterales bacterium]|nr:UXX-star (seleno)protein family 1 [Vicinamibacterales bacterium]